jgi:hypothetical protein
VYGHDEKVNKVSEGKVSGIDIEGDRSGENMCSSREVWRRRGQEEGEKRCRRREEEGRRNGE